MSYNIKQSMKKNLRKVLILAFMLILPIASFAQTTGDATTGKIVNPLGSLGPQTVTDFIKIVLQGALRIGIPILALAIIYSGFLFVAAQGKSEKLETAKKSLTYTIIGAAILLGAWALAQLITNTVIAL